MNDDQKRFVTHLKNRVEKYLAILEEMFGPSDPRFVFRTILESSRSYPLTYFPFGYHLNGGCVVDIHITKYPWEHYYDNQGTWQVAHECVHLLDPREEGSANCLEEGLATWFQDETRFHDEIVKRYIGRNSPLPQSYATAKRLVAECMPSLIPAVKTIRTTGVRIGDIKPDALAAHLANIDRQTIEALCARFE